MVAVWFAVTDGAVSTPVALIVPRFVVQVAREVTLVVVVSLQVAVAVYGDVEPSFTDAAPLIAMLLKVPGTFTMLTVTEFVRVTPPEV
jgi:hypothetical protein